MRLSINNKINFMKSFQFLSSQLDSLVENLAKNYFKYLIQECDNNVSDFVKLMNIWVTLKSLKNNYKAKKSFIVH